MAPLRDPMPSPLTGGSQSLNMTGEDDKEHVWKVASMFEMHIECISLGF